MINERPMLIKFKPRSNKPRMDIDEYLLKSGEEYFVLEVSQNTDGFIVKNGAGILVRVSLLDAEIVR